MLKKLFIALCALFFINAIYAQTDKEFWFVAPEVSQNHGDRPIYLHLTTQANAATITVSMPANSSFTTQVYNLAANTTRRVDLTAWIDQIENHYVEDYDLATPGKNNKGIHITSTEDITAYYETARSNNTDLFALKGKNALGSEFFVPFQNRYYNRTNGWYTFNPHSSANIVFSEDDSYITLDIPAGKAIRYGATNLTGTVRLGPFNRGETFYAAPAWVNNHVRPFPGVTTSNSNKQSDDEFGRSNRDHLSGLHIRAHDISGTILKNIAITQSDDSMQSFWGGYDVGGDQIVPLDIIGKEYIAIKGELESRNSTQHFDSWDDNFTNQRIYARPWTVYSWASNTYLPEGWHTLNGSFYIQAGDYNTGTINQETVFILATEDNTTIQVDGTNVATINRGETHVQELENNYTRIVASKNVYVWQVTGFGNEMGSAILPAIDKCTGSETVSFTRSTNNTFILNIMVLAGSEGDFRLNGSPHWKIPASAFQNTGSTYWKAARISFTTSQIPVGTTTVLSNTSGLFHVGIINGNSSGGTRYGYFSGFGDVPTINAAPSISGYALCAGDMELSVIGNPYTVYQWYRDNVAITGATGDKYTVSQPGRYKVTAITTCAGHSTETFPSNHIDAVPCIEVKDVTVTEGQPNAAVVVEMTHTMAVPISFDYATTDGTAINGKDYTEARGRATIPPGSLTTTIMVPVTDDNINEPDETFDIDISNPTIANINDSNATVTIKDNGDAQSKVSILATDNVAENVAGGKYNFEISLDKESGYDINVQYIISNGTATKPADYNVTTASATLTFAAGETTKTIELDIVDDNVFEPTPAGYETIITKIQNQTNATLDNSNGEIRITENETIPEITSANLIGNEGTNLDFVVNLSGTCSENVTVNYETLEVTATRGTDFTHTAGVKTLTFTPGQTSKTISIPAINDGAPEIPETFTLRFNSPVNATIASTPLNYTGTITDNTGTAMVFITDANVTEGGILTFNVNTTVINPTNDITFDFNISNISTNAADYTMPAPLSGAITRNTTTTTISVQTTQDTDEEGDEQLRVTLTNLVNANFVDDNAVGTIIDDDETPVAVNDNYIVNEDETTALTGNVLANDTGLGDTPITVVLLPGSSINGVFTFTDGNFSYTPSPNYHGEDTFSYEITDADGDKSVGVVKITVTSINDTPVAHDDTYNVLERTNPAYTILTGDVKANDTGLGDNAKAEIVANGSKGVVTILPDNTFTYAPTGQNFGVDQFTYRLRDDDGEISTVATAIINIAYYNNYNPQGVADSYTTPEATAISFKLTDNDTDQDGDATIDVGSVILDRAMSKGTITYNTTTGEFTYTPGAGETGFERFRYKVKDRSIESQPVRESAWTDVEIEILRNKLNPIANCRTFTANLDASGNVTVTPANINNGSSDPDGTIASMLIDGKASIAYDCSDIGDHVVQLTVIDNDGLQAQCNATVTVADNISPTVETTTTNIIRYCKATETGVTVTYVAPTFSDNCSGTGLNGTLIAGKSSGSFFNVGTTTVTYRFDDGNGTTPVESSFTVEVIQDNIDPVINCVTNKVFTENQPAHTYLVSDNSLNATATDARGIKSLTHNYNGGGTTLNGQEFPIGVTTVIWTAVDNFDNTATCSFNITVLPALSVSIVSDKAGDRACEQDPVTFTATPAGGTAPFEYTLLVDGVAVDGPQVGNMFVVTTFVFDDAVPANNTKQVVIRVKDNSGYTVSSNTINFTILRKPKTGEMYKLKNTLSLD
jgi:hypothetical protein